jgi:SARP family transcriptional regulator, regulator of embCAB operon
MTLASRAPTRIQLCGTTIVEAGDERLEGRLPGRQGRILFAFLVLNRDRPASRSELAEAVWPGEERAASESGLTPLISKLRRMLGGERIDGHATIRLVLDADTRVDVEDAVRAVHRAESQLALGNFTRAWSPSLASLFVSEREFLAGENNPWVDEQRVFMAGVRARALEAYAAACAGMGGTELPAAVRASRELVRLAPLRESGYQLLMRALRDEGNPAEALAVYAELRAVLRDELGVSPGPASQAMYAELIRG